MTEKRKWGIIVFLILIVFIVSYFQFQRVVLIKPRGIITDVYPSFFWSGENREYNLLVAKTESFENPVIDVLVGGNYFRSFRMDLGEYYWKLLWEYENKTFETKPVKFTIESFVAFSMEKEFLVNIGNVKSILTTPTGFVILDINQRTNLSEEEKYTFEQR
ncbi:MAG: hypothetical protein KKH88_01660 [Nanoarchaeota archaeon]|nr:hypothetical protein [Nanoarchaeota archaeon]